MANVRHNPGPLALVILCLASCVHAFAPAHPAVALRGPADKAAATSFPHSPRILARGRAEGRMRGRAALPSMTAVAAAAGAALDPRAAHGAVFESEVQLLPQDGIAKLAIKSDGATDEEQVSFAWAAFGGSAAFSGKAVCVEPQTANGTISNAAALEGNIAVVVRGVNSFVEKALLAQAAKASAVIIVNSDDELITPGNAIGVDDAVKVPVVLIGERDGRKLLAGAQQTPTQVSSGPRPANTLKRLVDEGGVVSGVVGVGGAQLSDMDVLLVQASTPLLPGESRAARLDARIMEKKNVKEGQTAQVLVAYNPEPGRLPLVFTVATATNITSVNSREMEAVVEGRFRAWVSGKGAKVGLDPQELAAHGTPVELDALSDRDSDSAEVKEEEGRVRALLSKLVKKIEELHNTPEAGPRFDRKHLDKAMAMKDSSLFSLACCALLPLSKRQRQLALQSTSTLSRLLALRFAMEKTLARYEETAQRRALPNPFQHSFISDAVRKVLPATVKIMPTGLRNTTGKGTGFIVSDDGLVVTNAHVASMSVGLTVTLNDGRDVKGKCIGRDSDYDIALVRLERPDEELPIATLGDSDDLRLGDWAAAIGNPSDCDNVVTQGIVSGFKRSDADPTLVDRSAHYILTDALYSRGMSGGPLLNSAGEVIGMNTFYRGDMNGMGFAIAINLIKDRIADMIELSKAESTAMCELVLHNDRFNTRERVSKVLKDIGLSNAEAERSMMEAHRNGRSILGVWKRDEAEALAQKAGDSDLLVEVRPFQGSSAP